RMATAAGRVPVPAVAQRPLAWLGKALGAQNPTRSPLRRVARGLHLLGQPPHRRYARIVSYFTPEQKYALYTDAMRDRLAGIDSYRLIDEAFMGSKADTTLGRIIDTDVNTYLPGDLLVKADISTMAVSLEARSPLLDHKVIEWAAGLPTHLKVRDGQTKYLLKRAVADWLPPELLNRPKMGFGVPLGSWLRTELRDLARDVLTDATARGRGLFRPDAVSALLDQHDAGIDHSSRIWALMQFELWHRTFVDGPRPGPRPGPQPEATPAAGR
ncbi:asparagine synthetase B, partial [Planosporangium thailandense]